MSEPCCSGPVRVVTSRFSVEEHFHPMVAEKLRAGKRLHLKSPFKGISPIT